MLTPKQLAGYRAGWFEHKRKKEKELEARYDKAMALAEKAAEHLKQNYHCRVILFGSLLRKEKFMEHSDIDLAISNLESNENFWKVYSEVMFILQPFNFDLLEISIYLPFRMSNIFFLKLLKKRLTLYYVDAF